MEDHEHNEIYNRGLQFDVSTLIRRRRLLGLFTGAGLAAVVGCSTGTPNTTAAGPSSGGGTTDPTTGTTPTGTATTNSTHQIPEETQGPFPGDGSNGPNILTRTGIVRGDVRSSIDSPSTVAGGVPLAIELTVLDLAAGGKPLTGGAVYIWHCDREGRYSMYSPGVTSVTYLRGVQEIDSAGRARFTSVFPGCYSGRWPHVHFEIYRSLASATSAGNKIATSQIALPEETCKVVYATDGYGQSVPNLAQTSLNIDMVFRDSWQDELGTITGSVASGFTVALTVPVR